MTVVPVRSRSIKVPDGTSSAPLRSQSGDRALDDRAEFAAMDRKRASGRNDRIFERRGTTPLPAA